MAEYSTLYPATSSASASGRSKGARLVSAKAETKNTTNMGKSGIANHTVFWARTMSVRLREPTQSSTVIMMKPMEIS